MLTGTPSLHLCSQMEVSSETLVRVNLMSKGLRVKGKQESILDMGEEGQT